MTWIRRGSLASASCVLALLATTASAWSAQRFAAPASGDGSGSCAQAAPCTASWALTGAADGEDVVLLPGTYSIHASLTQHRSVAIHGVDGQPAPTLVFSSAVHQDGLTLDHGASLRHVAIRMLGARGSALVLQGARADDVLLYQGGRSSGEGHAHAAAVLLSASAPTALADAVADAAGDGTTAVIVGGSQDGGQVSLTNVTALSRARGSAGIVSVLKKGSLSLTDVIVRGWTHDLVAASRESRSAMTTVDHSNFRPWRSSGFIDGGHNQASPPRFASVAGGDFHELTGSPTIDAGTVTAGSGSVDPDGTPRARGAAPDIGAYEYVPPAGGGAGGAPASGRTPGGDRVAPVPGATFATPGHPLSRPRVGRSFVVRRLRGVVTVEVGHQHGFVALSDRALLPFGSQIDTRHGAVAITAARDLAGALEVGRFSSGLFVPTQRRAVHAGGRPTVMLKLTGRELAGCPRLANGRRASVAGGRASVSRRRHRRRSLWSSDIGGNFSTHGQNSVAAVRGTLWLTRDTCNGTLTRVVRSRVLVHDLITGRRVLLRAGQSYLADLRRASRRHR